MCEDYDEYAALFKSLSDSNRLLIIEYLVEGERCACVILDKLNISQSTLSYHMKILCESEIINSRRDGKWMYYSINSVKLEKLKELLEIFLGDSCSGVINPTSCVDHSHDCDNDCCCPCESCEPFDKKVLVEYLYLDLKTCDRCMETDVVLEEVVTALTPALELAGYIIIYSKTEITTAELAMQYEFFSSPTIRVNGQDICQRVSETSCGCCCEISDTDVDCRVFKYDGETYEVPPKEKLADNILKCVFGTIESGCSCVSYELPDNLKAFFEGKKNKKCSY